jgi:DNA-binding transcriptional MerR regulator
LTLSHFYLKLPSVVADDPITLAELEEKSGVPARTIRFYISRGLLDGPAKAGRGAAYTGAHVDRLAKIRALQEKGHVLSEIAGILSGGGRAATVPATAWWQHAIGDDVVIWTKADLSPWRMKQVRAVIQEMANRLAKEEEESK